jgi:signal transduction histidine kinase
MSATARRRGAGKRWDVPATPALPDVVKPAKARKQAKAAPQPTTAPPPDSTEGGVDAVKRRLNRLALDVHDGPMQNLAVIGFSLGDLRRKMHALVPEGEHAHIDEGMAQIGAELGRVESELRALIGALEDGGVTSVPVVDAIEMEIAEFTRRSAVMPQLIVEGDVQTETDSQRIALQSVTRAALANVAKHAAAKTVKIRLHGTPDTITLEIEDDGRGFHADHPPKKGRFGVTGMRERIEMLGGQFELDSRPGGPTTITATLETWRPPSAA